MAFNVIPCEGHGTLVIGSVCYQKVSNYASLCTSSRWSDGRLARPIAKMAADTFPAAHVFLIFSDGASCQNSFEVCIVRTSLVIVSFYLALVFPLFARAAEQSVETRRAELNRLLADEWEYTLRTQPELATQVGDNRYNDRLSDFSDKAIADDLEHTRQVLPRFEAVDATGFPEQEKLNRALMLRSLREALEAAQFKDWEMPATQFGGIHLGYAGLAFDSPFRNKKDYEDYLSRLHQIPRVLEQAMGHMRDGLRDHRMPPKYLLEKVSAQAQEIADDPLDKSPLTDPLRKFPESISETERKPLREQS